MRKLSMALAGTLTATSLTLLGCSGGSGVEGGQDANGPNGAAKQAAASSSDIVDTALAAGDFGTLAAALQAADLVETLKSDGPFTVFAPTDDAFAKLPEGTVAELLLPENKEQLISVLTYHVVPGKVGSADVVSLSSAKTVNVEEVEIAVKDGSVSVSGGKVIKADIDCSNGVIHVIDSVLLPPAAASEEHGGEALSIEGVGSFGTLFAAIEAAGLKETLSDNGPFTVFAPTDAAFAALPDGTLEALLKPEGKDKLVSILTYHVVPGEVASTEVVEKSSVKTVNGAELSIKVAEGVVQVGDAKVLKTDVPCEVGIIHAIDKVLLP